MRVSLHLEVLGTSLSFDALDRIADLFRTGRHDWVIASTEIDAIDACYWLASEPESRAGQRHRDLFEKNAKLAVEQGGARIREAESADPPPSVRQHVVIGGPGGVTLDEGWALLAEPARLLVEDDISDRRFLDCLINVFCRDALSRALEEGWLKIVHCGGKGGIPKRAERILLESSGSEASRVLALLDSDRLFTGHETDSVKLAKRLCDMGVRVCLLRKRETENYLPFAALDGARQRKAYVAYRDRLTPEQQDYFDMKGGFSKGREGAEIVPPLQQSLFSNVPKGVRRNLMGGFGGACGELFARPAVTREGLEARCRQNDSGATTELIDFLLELEAML